MIADRGRFAVAFGEGALDVGDVVRDALRLYQKLLRALDGGLQLGQPRIRQAREIARLVDQHLRFVLKLRDLIVDLFESTGGLEDVLCVVGGVEDRDGVGRRRRERRYAGDRQGEGGGGKQRAAQALTGHGRVSFSWAAGSAEVVSASSLEVRSSAAQSRPRCWSQAAAKPSGPCSVSNSVMAA